MLYGRQGFFEPDLNVTNATASSGRRKPSGWSMAVSVDLDLDPARRPGTENLTPEEAELVRAAEANPRPPPRISPFFSRTYASGIGAILSGARPVA